MGIAQTKYIFVDIADFFKGKKTTASGAPRARGWKQRGSQQMQDVESMLVQRCFTIYDVGPTVNQHWFDVLCLMGYMDKKLLGWKNNL